MEPNGEYAPKQNQPNVNDVRKVMYDILTYDPQQAETSPFVNEADYLDDLPRALQNVVSKFKGTAGVGDTSFWTKMFASPENAANQADNRLRELLPPESKQVHRLQVLQRVHDYWGRRGKEVSDSQMNPQDEKAMNKRRVRLGLIRSRMKSIEKELRELEIATLHQEQIS